jgi:hypothetical protein
MTHPVFSLTPTLLMRTPRFPLVCQFVHSAPLVEEEHVSEPSHRAPVPSPTLRAISCRICGKPFHRRWFSLRYSCSADNIRNGRLDPHMNVILAFWCWHRFTPSDLCSLLVLPKTKLFPFDWCARRRVFSFCQITSQAILFEIFRHRPRTPGTHISVGTSLSRMLNRPFG